MSSRLKLLSEEPFSPDELNRIRLAVVTIETGAPSDKKSKTHTFVFEEDDCASLAELLLRLAEDHQAKTHL